MRNVLATFENSLNSDKTVIEKKKYINPIFLVLCLSLPGTHFLLLCIIFMKKGAFEPTLAATTVTVNYY